MCIRDSHRLLHPRRHRAHAIRHPGTLGRGDHPGRVLHLCCDRRDTDVFRNLQGGDRMIRFPGYYFAVLAIAATALSLAAVSAYSQESRHTVLTSLEAPCALGEALAAGTSLRMVNVIPEGYPMRGQDAYLKKHRETFFKVAAAAEAVLTVGAAWPADPLYRWARRGNIRIVNVDCTRPLDGYGAGVPVVEVEGKPSPYVWRSPANMTRMAAIAAADLCRLFPEERETIRANLKKVQAAMFTLRSRYEAIFLSLDFVGLAAFTNGYACLVDEFGFDVGFSVLAPESAWSSADVERIAARLRRDGVKAVICAWEPDAKGRKAIRDGGAVPVVLDRFERGPGSPALESLVRWYEGNLSRLAAALKQ
eukprot:TRINITY_DN4306_c0_g1_i1.p2 TRINITY_DN4306_c0_g1~~TRINITY_DN4306_c0_g1_i1.p2  ORF type:complete len:404 (+),score=111.27 TRINITY_DN4306_c0_g1_i1:123-1214(+)